MENSKIVAAISLISLFSNLGFAAAPVVEKHCFSEAQDAVVSAILKDVTFAKDLSYVTVTKVELVSKESTELYEVSAAFSQNVPNDSEASKNSTAKYLVVAAPHSCDPLAANLMSISSSIAKP
jgi:hypothetical protein